jgi:hypothetical protein
MFEVRGKISAGVQTAGNLDEQSLTCRFAQVMGMDTERIQISRTHDGPFLDNRNELFHGQSWFCHVESPKKAAVTETCIGDCSTNLDSRKGRHIKSGSKIWGTVWGTTVPEQGFFTPKMGFTGRAKSIVPSNRAWDFIRC